MTGPPDAARPPTCPRHPDVVSYVSCQRCERPACPDCQRPAAVGVQCVDCVAQAGRTAPRASTRFGARVRPDGSPIVTMVLIGLCVAVYLGQLASPQVTAALAYVPAFTVAEPWRMVTAAFAHSPSSYFHILFNMYALWIVGSYLEPLLGRARFAALYLVGAIGGSVGYLALAQLPERVGQPAGWVVPTVGASGAVFGLFAAMLVLNRRLGRQTGGIAVVLVINTVIGFVVPNIAWQAHLGGALTGAAVAGALVATSAQERETRQRRQRWFWLVLGVILLAIGAVAGWRLGSVGPQWLA